MRYKKITARVSTGRDQHGEFVEARALNVYARYWGGEYIELRFGKSGPAFHVLNTTGAEGETFTTGYVARELEEFLKEEKDDLPGYRESVGL